MVTAVPPSAIASVEARALARGVRAGAGQAEMQVALQEQHGFSGFPVLDGGHLLYYAIEAVWRRPLPESFQVMGLRIGVALMGSVMLLAILNDLRRLF